MTVRRWTLATTLLMAACGPSYEGQDVKTPDELVAEQEAIQAESEKNNESGYYNQGEGEETDLEKKAKFDKKQTELELKRAARSAATCNDVVTKPESAGTASVSLTFSNNGQVKEASLSGAFSETETGECVLKAMKTVIVPPYEGPEETVTWEVEVEAKSEAKKDDKKKK